ncbi:phosphogluconate dehydratase [Planktotalea sp.]|uniref:phosphogluconate dehydratase n=1 Tax=Planktotalea sp. TaxID=2029877 RepID=UPI0025F137F7|nr:phosphogluconate dehydratase [Planktotalea sp.]
MSLHPIIKETTDRILERSQERRSKYMAHMRAAASEGPRRGHLTCGNQAHAYAAMGDQQHTLAETPAPNLGILTSYNDMLSAHQPFEGYPAILKEAALAVGATAQVAGGVPAMCDGVTQGQTGMELSLFSRDVIALAAGIGLSHNTFDAAAYLGVCDKIVPGLIIAAATFGYIPGIFVPAGPMQSGLPNDEKARVRNEFTEGKVDRAALMKAEMASYHSAGTCTFYGTANSNQMLMEFMGLHLPGASFVNPNTPLRDALTREAAARVLSITSLGNDFRPVCDVLDERAFVNGIVGLMATGGSTNLVLHLPAMARAAGVDLRLEDFDAISSVVPLMAKVYPNGLADVNHFHAAGGLPYMIGRLLDAGLLHEDVTTVYGSGLGDYANEPALDAGALIFRKGASESQNDKILRPANDPFQKSGGLKQLMGNLGHGMMKVSAVDPTNQIVEAPARVFHSQDEVKAAFKAGEFNSDLVIVVRFQGPKANGMPELHGLTPAMSVTMQRGHKIALVTDGRMSGASGKVPSCIHVSPEAAAGGPLSRIQDGDIIRVDATTGTLECLTEGALDRPIATPDLSHNGNGVGRELFDVFRQKVGTADTGAGVVV